MPKVSIIVPVYKVEQYICECLDSIKQQTFMDWECLLIDDGSPDNSGKICDEYAKNDARFKVFHVENGGVCRARNIGLDNMSGEWVMFVDSDDVIALNTLELCINHVEKKKLDMLQFSFSRDYKSLGNNDEVKTDVMSLHDFINSEKVLVCIAGSLIKTSIICSNNLNFDTNLKLAEDQLFIFECMSKTERLQKIDDILYWYRDNPISATHTQRTVDMINSVQSLIELKNNIPDCSMYVDRMNVMFFIRIILNKDLNIWQLQKMINNAALSDSRLVTHGLPSLFFKTNRFSGLLAILVVRLRALVLHIKK